PSRRDLFDDPDLLAAYPYFTQLAQVAKTTVARPPVGQYAQLSDILQRYLSAALSDQMSPEEAMTAAARESRRVLGTTTS
ncbi:MAG: ABC transporter substrate-binding protein, partial [Cyanobacteria bacterium J06638_6]